MTLDKTTRAIKSVVLVFNGIFFAFGCVLVGVGSWSLYEFGRYEAISISVPYAAASKLMITAGVFNILVSSFGFWAAPKENRRLFVIFFLALVVIFGLEVSAVASGLHHREKVSHTLYDDMFFVIRKVYRIKTAPSEAFNDLQENERCCGCYNYTDWRNSFFTQGNASIVPYSCCKVPERNCGVNFNVANIYTQGCYWIFLHKIIRGNLNNVIATAVAAVVLKVLGMLCVLALILKIEQTAEKLPLSYGIRI